MSSNIFHTFHIITSNKIYFVIIYTVIMVICIIRAINKRTCVANSISLARSNRENLLGGRNKRIEELELAFHLKNRLICIETVWLQFVCPRESKWCVKRLKCQSKSRVKVYDKNYLPERIGYMKGLIKRGWIIKINLNRRTRENFTLLFARDKGPIKYGDNKNYYVCREIIVIML